MNKFFVDSKAWLLEKVNPIILGVFRIAYGLFMTYELIYFIRIGFVKNMFVLPSINFKYDYLEWLQALPEFWMNGILVLLMICTLAITVGIFFKWACRVFAVGFAYI